MAITRAAKFAIECRGDGATSTFNFVIATSAFWYTPPSPSAIDRPMFDLSINKPADVTGVYTNTGGAPSVTAASITTLGTILSVTFDAAPTSNLIFTVCGTFIF